MPIGDGSPLGVGSLACAQVAQTASLMMNGSSLLLVSFTIASRLVVHEFTWPLLRVPVCCEAFGRLNVLAAVGKPYVNPVPW